MVKTKNMSTQIYMMVFYIRRMIVLALCYFVPRKYDSDKNSSLVLVITCILNYIYTIYIGSTNPLEGK
jgi:hypothetical protein